MQVMTTASGPEFMLSKGWLMVAILPISHLSHRL